MTEEEAKNKRCPYGASANFPATCSGAKCMAWRFKVTLKREQGTNNYYPRMVPDLNVPVIGYCGLAGKP